MPLYKVTKRGFMFGQEYSPQGKRRTLRSDKPLNPVPSWLEVLDEKKETTKEKKARLAAEAKAQKAAEEAAEKQKQEIDNVNFLDESGKGETVVPVATQSSTVTTL